MEDPRQPDAASAEGHAKPAGGAASEGHAKPAGRAASEGHAKPADRDSPQVSAGLRLDEAFGAARPAGRIEQIFGTRDFLRLWIAQIVSATGDWLGLVATISLAARISEGSKGSAIALVLASRVAPGLFLATSVGVIVDRLNRKRVMICCDVGRALVLITLPFVDTLVGLLIASVVLELLTMMWQPAKEATVPNLVPREKLMAANSLNVAAAYGMFPVAAGLAALLSKIAEAVSDEGWVTNLRLNEEGLAFYVDGLSFAITALIVWRITIPVRSKQERRSTQRWRLDLGSAVRELRDGWRLVAENPIVRSVNVGLATAVMGAGIVFSLGALFVDEVLVGREADFNLVLFALGVGMAVGVGSASAMQNRINHSRGFSLALFGAGLMLFAVASVDRLSMMVPLVVALGMMAGPSYVLGFTLLHEHVENEMRGRVFSALLLLVRLCLLVALAIAPALSELFGTLSDSWFDGDISVFGGRLPVPGVRITMWLAAVVIAIAGGLANWSLRVGPRRADTRASASDSLSDEDS